VEKEDCVIKTCNIHQAKEDKENEMSLLRKRLEELSNEIEKLRTAKIGKTTMEETMPQLKAKVVINRKEIEATVDCGADVNYANKMVRSTRIQNKNARIWMDQELRRKMEENSKKNSKHSIQATRKISKTDI
jgi:hypothetical protein